MESSDSSTGDGVLASPSSVEENIPVVCNDDRGNEATECTEAIHDSHTAESDGVPMGYRTPPVFHILWTDISGQEIRSLPATPCAPRKSRPAIHPSTPDSLQTDPPVPPLIQMDQTATSSPKFAKTLLVFPSVTDTPEPIPIAHIEAEGFDDTLPLTEHHCNICKRDLSYTSEGRVFQPTVPPAVAFLPCGHVFHEDCLLRNTPEDQAKDPPCIPCAIGET